MKIKIANITLKLFSHSSNKYRIGLVLIPEILWLFLKYQNVILQLKKLQFLFVLCKYYPFF